MVLHALRLRRLPCRSLLAINREAFYAALTLGIYEGMRQYGGALPIVHISAHGSPDGIQLSSGDVVTWQALRELFVPLNRAFAGGLLVSMSTCEGVHATAMTFQESGDLPFAALIAPHGSPTWMETGVGYAAYYHLIASGRTIHDAVDAMNAACGKRIFHAVVASQARDGWLAHIAQVNAAAAEAQVEAISNDASEHGLAKQIRESGDA